MNESSLPLLLPRGRQTMITFSLSHHEFDSLYCQENEEESYVDNGEVIQKTQEADSDERPCFTEFEEQDLSILLQKEEEFEGGASACFLRAEMVEWMLGVVGFYSFSAQTALLAVNYLDRFFDKFEKKKKQQQPWMIQLAAVACLSLAAKVEETHVPLLLDLQVESMFVFEAKTIQRMEILVLSTLRWKMNSVTPISFLHYLAKKLRLKGFFFRDFINTCESILFSVVSDSRFMRCSPSALATATMIHVIGTLQPTTTVERRRELVGILGISDEKVEISSDLIRGATAMKYNTNPHSNKRKKKSISIPDSPTGVFDACFSSETANTPPSKKIQVSGE